MEAFIRHNYDFNNHEDLVLYDELRYHFKKLYGCPIVFNYADVLIEKWIARDLKIEFFCKKIELKCDRQCEQNL